MNKQPRNEKAPSAATLEALKNTINFEVDCTMDTTKTQPLPQVLPSRYGTPEELMTFRPFTSLDEVQDLLTCMLGRIESQVHLMMIAAESESLSGDIQANNLWSLLGQLEQVHAVILARGTAGRALQ